ncbi:hypothetical protein [Wolbachia endosymbiont of Folsomia candida]|uniref:hypothetical protein n=1 Tax=Wolbachia endosymbiont of Folsomia candida TaxID=169402 RepID=UPI000B248E42|nr:hypothetical protein [Wolbachia endosymbiont of Folsomia candida]APR98192.1 hypothetical protein ASM33_02665 [Wolbachia endosymbiont of Folsomia candida]
MVKTIKKTYSVGNDKVTRTITLSEESPTSQSSESYSHSPYDIDRDIPIFRSPLKSYSHSPYNSDMPGPNPPYSSNTPVGYGFANDGIGDGSGIIKGIGFGRFSDLGEIDSSQSPTSYSSDTPVGYGCFEEFFGNTVPEWARGRSAEHRPNLVGTDNPLPHQSPASYSSNTPVKYGLIDDTIRAALDVIKEIGVEKFCNSCSWMKMLGITTPTIDKLYGACDLMKKMGFLASPTAESGDQSSYTKVGYNGIYGGGNPDSIMPCTKVGYDVVCPDGIYYRVPMVMPDYPEDYI